MINIVKFDGKLVESVECDGEISKLSDQSHPLTIISRDASVFREDFLAGDKFCCCEKQ